jgi:GRAM domain-containing protein 4
LVLRIFLALLNRRIFSHPSLEDLRRHREEIICANEFGDQVSARLSASSTDVTEVIHLFKLLKERRNKTAKQKAKDKNSAHRTEEIGDVPLRERDMSVPEDTDKEEAADIKRIAIYALNEIADVHERVKKCVPFS